VHLVEWWWLRAKRPGEFARGGRSEELRGRRDLGACSAVRGGCQGDLERRGRRSRPHQARSRLLRSLHAVPPRKIPRAKPARVALASKREARSETRELALTQRRRDRLTDRAEIEGLLQTAVVHAVQERARL